MNFIFDPGLTPPQIAVLALIFSASTVGAQDRSLVVTPAFSITQQFTDNLNLSASNPRSESITTISPGVRLSVRSSRLQGSLDYSLNGVIYGRESASSNFQNALRSSLQGEFLENHGFVNASASISRQSISALELQGDRPSSINANSTELRSFSLAPSLRGRLFGDVNVNASLAASVVSSAGGDSSTQSAALGIGDSSRAIGWALDLNRVVSDFDGGRRSQQDSLRATLSYAPQPDLRLFVNGGTELNNVQTAGDRSSVTWGGGVTWQPTPRTQFGLTGEKRFFGNSHSLSFSHRMQRSVISYTDSRSSTQNTAGAGAVLTVYDIYFVQFASLEPDPVLRDLLVRNFLQASGLNANERLTGGFINRALTLQSSRNLSLALQGARSNAVLSAFSSSSRRLDGVSNAQDDLSRVDVLQQAGWSLSLSHRLTPNSSIVLSTVSQRTPGRGAVAGNGLKSASLSWSSQVQRRISLSVTARHAQAVGPNSYDENSVRAALGLSF